MSRICLAPTDPYTRRSVSEDALHVNKHERVQSESGKGKPIMSGQNVHLTGKTVPYGFNIGRRLPFCSKTAAI